MTTRKIITKKRTSRKKREGGGTDLDIFQKYLTTLKPVEASDNCEIKTIDDFKKNKCFIPTSKSDQVIRICGTNGVFKGPKDTFSPQIQIDPNKNHIKVDPHTMNLLVQSAIKSLGDNTIEQYESVCKADGYSYALKGFAYQLPIGRDCTGETVCTPDKKVEGCCPPLKIARSVEDYINIMNGEIKTSPLQTKKNEVTEQIIIWMKSIVKSLDFLFEKLQFHHCDPKAAQLFLNGKNVIVGDLDKVTFSMNINNAGTKKSYRICLGNILAATAAKARGSIPEKMRYETEPRPTNNYEKAAFMASILLLLHDAVRGLVWSKMTEHAELNDLIQFIDYKTLLEKAKQNTEFAKRATHTIASKCVYSHNTQLKSEFGIGGTVMIMNPMQQTR